MNEENKNLDPQTAKKILTIIIAILSAIAGAIGESATNFIANVF